MKPEYLEKLNVWFTEQILAVKAEGASEQDFKDPAIADLVLRKIFEVALTSMPGLLIADTI